MPAGAVTRKFKGIDMKYTMILKEKAIHPKTGLFVHVIEVNDKDFDIDIERRGVLVSEKDQRKAFSFQKWNIIQIIAEDEQ